MGIGLGVTSGTSTASTTGVASGAARASTVAAGKARLAGAQRGSDVQAGLLLLITYSLLHDSSGTHPKAGVEVHFLFAADGQAFVYAASSTEALADPGTYSYTGGDLTLHINTPDIKANATFPLPLSKSQVTMPFQVFSPKPGSSLWQQEPMSLDQGLYAIINAASNEPNGSLSQAQEDQMAYAYAQAWVAAGSVVSPALRTNAFGTHSVRAPASRLSAQATPPPTTGQCSSEGTYCITGVQNLGNDIQINYKDSPPVVINLFDWAPSTPGSPLLESPLFDDPRVNIDPKIHPDGGTDPPNKTAVLISPFTYFGTINWGIAVPAHTSLEPISVIYSMASTLKRRGYKADEVLGSDATVLGLVKALKVSPGIVLAVTHGDSGGDLMTAETVEGEAALGLTAVHIAYLQEQERLIQEGLGPMVNYEKGPDGPLTFVLAEEDCSFLFVLPTASCGYKVMVTPIFWQWLRAQLHVSFAKSLVYIGACETEQSSTLRTSIEAGAYFAFRLETSADLATDVSEYLVEFLARPTHSPEEAFYNMLLIQKAHTMIYTQDEIFNKQIGAAGTSTSLTGNLDGWGLAGGTWFNYRETGWMSGKLDPGEVWWMLYAGRWDTSSSEGADALLNCYQLYWSHGNPGGLANTYCNAANAGNLKANPKLSGDVHYAVYLLDGIKPAGFPASLTVPRWTMDDAA
jgi:hypothetical protein